MLAIPVNDRDHTLGPPNASVIIVNYGDYQCPDCHRRHREIQKVIDELRDRVRFVYRHFPLVRAHPDALRAAEAAEAASAQGKFWEMHRHLYLRPNKLGDNDLRHYANQIGLDVKRFDTEMQSGTYKDFVLKDYHNSIIYGISGSPTTFINGELHADTSTELIAIVRAILKGKGNQ